jgi:hypothetical protein
MALRVAPGVVAVVLAVAAPVVGQATTTTTAEAATTTAATAAPAATTVATTAATTVPTTAATTAATTVATTVATTRPPRTTRPTSATTTTPATTTTTSVTTTTHPASTSSGTSGTTIAIIIAAVVVGLALIGGAVLLINRNRQRSQWSERAQTVAADAHALGSTVERSLPLLRDPASAAQVWVDFNTRLGHVRSGLTALTASAPDQHAKVAIGRATQALDALQASIDSDRSLRMGPPPPSEEQIGYSEALLTQRATELGRAADELLSAAAPAS